MVYKIKLGFVLFILGTIGVLSMLTVEIPMGELPKAITDRFTPQEIKMLTLLNPLLLLITGVLVRTALHEKVNLKIRSIKALLNKEITKISFKEQLKAGVIYGTVAGLFITIIASFFESFFTCRVYCLG